MKKKHMKLSGIILSSVIIIVGFVYAVNIQPAVTGEINNDFWTDNPDIDILGSGDDGSHSYKLVSFNSYEALTKFLDNCSSSRYGEYDYNGKITFFEEGLAPTLAVDSFNSHKGGTTVDFSQTNIQVQGVDEPDTVKTDGKYLYLVKGRTVFIILAYPADEAKIISKIELGYNVQNIFINGDRLVVFGNQNSYFICDKNNDNKIEIESWYSSSNTFVKVYDLENREEPVLKRDVVIGGDYYNARMIGEHVYIITNQHQYDIRANYDDNNTVVPLISENGVVKKIPLKDIYCIDIPEYSYTLVHVVSVDIQDDSNPVVDKIFTMGNSQTMYVSKNNIYITYNQHSSEYEIRQEVYDEILMPLISKKIQNDIEYARNFDISENNKKQVIEWILDGFLQTVDQEIKDDIESEIQRRLSSTVIHKISVKDGKIEYMCNGSVPGQILNQFSMDEHNGFFRVATQLGKNWRSNIKKSTNVYILDTNLKTVGRVNNIAAGENLHSARFMGDRAYLVTFKNIDPFFTLDLSDPYNPQILGELKIPGYSDYLHPFDENHVIGIGKDSDASIDADKIHSDNAVYYTAILGVKIALFDVSDFKNPKEISKTTIGDRGTNTPVLNNHKAFLFDKEKELLVLPISLYEVSEEIKEQKGEDWRGTKGSFKLNGAYVYHLSLEKGFKLKGVITHNENNQQQNNGWNNYPEITRSLYIDNALYTISNNMVKINNLDNLDEITSITLV